jgi:hypothetical protein
MSGGWERPPAAIHGLGLTRNDGTSKAQAVTTQSGGASTTARTCNSGRCGMDDRQGFPNDHVLRRLIREAEFVLEHDPYRGMLLDVRKQHPGSAASLIDNPQRWIQRTKSATRTPFSTTRRSCQLGDSQSIFWRMEYLASLLSCLPHEETKDVSVNGLLQIFQQWQKNLIYENPIERNHLKDDETSSTFHIAAPPGISNLGATCYLNTQLQCLAQTRHS